MIKWMLWLDDQFDQEDISFRHPPIGFIPAKTSKEAIAFTERFGVPEFISFDHDLGENDNAMKYIDWLIENHYENNVPGFQVHSANPVGKANIISKMNSWKKSQSL